MNSSTLRFTMFLLATGFPLAIGNWSLAILEVSVLDLRGRILLRQSLRTDALGDLRVEIGSVAAGMYLLRLSAESGVMARRVVVW
jgi:hypothetical protein